MTILLSGPWSDHKEVGHHSELLVKGFSFTFVYRGTRSLCPYVWGMGFKSNLKASSVPGRL